ncbi:helix-turn-helix domain-containing protein [Actinomadura coerulea]|uniref:helix-turn-helix domain-containing protein n=1 Tax=Actinomadura coerulea TaxID=46159 RepID=UPI003431ADE4
MGRTPAEVAQILGVSQSRVSQIENGDLGAMELETLRAYATPPPDVIRVSSDDPYSGAGAPRSPSLVPRRVLSRLFIRPLSRAPRRRPNVPV